MRLDEVVVVESKAEGLSWASERKGKRREGPLRSSSTRKESLCRLGWEEAEEGRDEGNSNRGGSSRKPGSKRGWKERLEAREAQERSSKRGGRREGKSWLGGERRRAVGVQATFRSFFLGCSSRQTEEKKEPGNRLGR